MEKIEVQEYSLYGFLKRAQELFEEGYRFDFEKNENVPTSYGTLLVANMFRKQVDEEFAETGKPVITPEEITIVVTEPEVPVVTDEAPVVARKSTKAAKS